MKILHRPMLNTDKVVELYTKKDGAPIKYVCTSALGSEEFAGDIFYRDTTHPVFGNRYFQLYYDQYNRLMIRSADVVEQLTFDTVWNGGGYVYSQHRHDYVQAGPVAIDGGRAYTRLVGSNPSGVPVVKFKVKNGIFGEDLG